jgi:hypothetical protein
VRTSRKPLKHFSWLSMVCWKTGHKEKIDVNPGLQNLRIDFNGNREVTVETHGEESQFARF